MRKTPTLLALAAATLCVNAAQAATTNLVKNGDFERFPTGRTTI